MLVDLNQKRWRAADVLSLLFLFFLILLNLFFRRQIPKWEMLLILYLFLSGIIFFLVFTSEKHGVIFKTLHNFIFPALLVFVLFDSLCDNLVPFINPIDGDYFLIKADYSLFGLHPTVWLENFSKPWLTDVLQIAYISYYFLPFFLLIPLAKKEKEKFGISLFLIILCFYLSFIGYIFVPALGPRFALAPLQNGPLEGSFITDSIQKILNSLEGIKRDAFPSAHTAVSLVVLFLSFRFRRRLFFIYLPIITALIFSTVYLRYHYVVDVIAGFILSLVVLFFGGEIYKAWEKKIKRKILEEI